MVRLPPRHPLDLLSGKPGRDGEICLDLSQLATDVFTAGGRLVRASAAIPRTKLVGDGQQQHRTTGNRRDGRQ
jgi:hypothetical protein